MEIVIIIFCKSQMQGQIIYEFLVQGTLIKHFLGTEYLKKMNLIFFNSEFFKLFY